MSSRIIISIRKVLWLYEGYGEEGFGGEMKIIENIAYKITGGQNEAVNDNYHISF